SIRAFVILVGYWNFTAFAFVSFSKSLKQFKIRRLVKTYDRYSIFTYIIIEDKSLSKIINGFENIFSAS
ncbi:hypothetical protein V1477_001483, partial [Vespula maculifrons]